MERFQRLRKAGMKMWKLEEELWLFTLQYYCYQPEYWEESWRPKETCCDLDTGVKNSYNNSRTKDTIWKGTRPDPANLHKRMSKNVPDTINIQNFRCPWCNGYHRRKWIRRHEFKCWTRLIAFHIALIPLGKVWIQLLSFQLWVNSRAD